MIIVVDEVIKLAEEREPRDTIHSNSLQTVFLNVLTPGGAPGEYVVRNPG